MQTETQFAIAAIIRQRGPLTAPEIEAATGFCRATVCRVLRRPQFQVVGQRRVAGQRGSGAHIFDLADRPNVTFGVRPDPAVDAKLDAQLTLAQAIGTLARDAHAQSAHDLAKLWLSGDREVKRMIS